MVTSGGRMRARDRGQRGQSSVLGVVLVIGLVLAGTAIVVVLGSGAMLDMRSQTELERAEHSMTLFNSRAAMAALGDSPTQQVSFGGDRGAYEIREDDSWLRITHADHTANGDDETLYEASLGTVVYENGGTEIAYQGGGVWRKEPGGTGRMVSPPEFHYRAATLTLPIVRVHDAGGSTTGSDVEITRSSDTRRIFPNASATYEEGSSTYENPVANGTVNVTVQSPYYEGWEAYFRSNTDGNVTVLPDENQVRVTLVSLAGSIDEFDMPREGNALGVRGIGDEHPVSDFEISLMPDGHYQNMHWSFYADEGNEQLEIHLHSNDKCKNNGGFDGELDASIYYYNASGSETIHEEWQTEGIDVATNDDFDIDCDTGELTVDFLGSTPLAYGDIEMTGSDNKWLFGPEISNRDVADTTTSFGAHLGESDSYSTDTQEEMGVLVNHYLQLTGPTYDLTVTDGPGGSSRVDESRSEGRLVFETGTGAKYITYLHVTENEVEVSFD